MTLTLFYFYSDKYSKLDFEMHQHPKDQLNVYSKSKEQFKKFQFDQFTFALDSSSDFNKCIYHQGCS